jgi:hypothetical protein
MTDMPLRLSIPTQLSAHELAIRIILLQGSPDSTHGLEVVEDQSQLVLQTEAYSVKGINTICQALCKVICPDKLGGSEEQQAQV